ncbi:hypothetical protein RAS1_26460 [Phycisphaerae bacterium RAS1]|nr:hypothetical protein RAS1_26460 [Phycisphaerae bacterium RAS1]
MPRRTTRSPDDSGDFEGRDEFDAAPDEFTPDEDADADTDTVACPACGAEVADLSDRCPVCGDWIIRNRGSRAAWWIVATVVALLALFAWSILGRI